MKVVITDGFTDAAIEEEVFAPAGLRVASAEGLPEAQALELICDADALLALARPLAAPIIARLQRCRVIVRYGSGMDSVDWRAARSRGIVVASVPDSSVQEVAAHALGLILFCARKLWAFREVDRFDLGDPSSVAPLPRLSQTTLGLIGFGRIARQVARIAAPLFGSIRAYDPLMPTWDWQTGVSRAKSLKGLLKRADFLSLHAPLTPDTRHLMGFAQFRDLKPGASLVNTARGGLVDEAALEEALTTGRLAGAGLDVLEEEPPRPGHPLLRFPQVYYTPHLAWYSKVSRVEVRRRAAREVVRVLSGQPARNPFP